MKRILPVITLMVLMMSATGCTTTQNLNTGLQRKWMLISMKEFSKDELMHAQATVDLTSKDGKVSGYTAFMGCNNLSFRLNEKTGNKVSVSRVSGTKMFCPNHLDLENQFISLFPTMNSYSVEGHFLTLTNNNGDKMKFVAADWD